MKDINDIWGFIEENYKGYYNSDAILEHDILGSHSNCGQHL